MIVKMALAQPVTAHGQNARDSNLETASRYATDASNEGAHIICYPENFPGQWRKPITWTPLGELQEMARHNNIYILGGYAEPLDDGGARCYQSVSLLDPHGKEIVRYRRTIPNIYPWIYLDGPYWDFEWVRGDELPVVDTDIGKIGVLVCSEVYSPELCRILALKGAEIILMPNGFVPARRGLYHTWRTLLWARAIENLAYTATSSNLPTRSEQGLAMVSGPEAVVIEKSGEGLHYAEIELDRVRWLRNETDRAGTEPPWGTKPGVLRDWTPGALIRANSALWA